MKKQFFYVVFLLFSTSIFSQKLTDEIRELYARDPANASANIQALLQDKSQATPPVQKTEIMLTDSVYYSNWVAENWQVAQRELLTYDCETGDLVQSITQGYVASTGLFINDIKLEYSYHAAGKVDETQRFLYDIDLGQWMQINYSKKTADGRTLESWDKAWDSTIDEFAFGTKSVNTYDASKLLLWEQFNYEPSSNSWIPTNRDTYTYNTSNLEELRTIEMYDPVGGTWSLTKKIISTYTSSGDIETRLNENYSNGTLFHKSMQTYTYLANGDLLKIINEVFDPGTGNFFPTSQADYTYNPQGEIETILTTEIENGQWVNSDLSEYIYYGDDAIKTSHVQEWDPDDNLWVTIQKDSFGADGKVSFLQLMFTYDPTLNVYDFGFRLYYDYDGDLLLGYLAQRIDYFTFDAWKNEFQISYTYENDVQRLELLNQRWDEMSNDWINDYLYHYYNTGCLFSGTNGQTLKFSNCRFANPISQGQTINCPDLKMDNHYSLEIYTMGGSRVVQEKFNGIDQPILNTTLPQGMYLMLIRDKGEVLFREKVVVAD